MTSRLISLSRAAQVIPLLILESIVSFPNNSLAQNIRLDDTLGSARELAGPHYLIKQSDGRTVRQNLFHSFQKFNLNKEEKAIFESGVGIRNILTRVTGGFRSEINGLIKTNSGVNFFLINPSGIIFGESAQLDIGGSFVATTANAVKFGDKGVFNASIPNDPALLTINPSALVFNQPRAESIVNNSSEDARTRIGFLVPQPLFGLRVPDQNSLLLVGGNLSLNNGGLNAIGGRIELAAVSGQGEVGLIIEGNQLSLNVPKNLALADISLENESLIDASGEKSGNIRLYGNNIRLREGSGILSQVFGNEAGGSIILNASNSIELIGAPESFAVSPSRVWTLSYSSGTAGDRCRRYRDYCIRHDQRKGF
jgi:filamentous hemagglutinin family protein